MEGYLGCLTGSYFSINSLFRRGRPNGKKALTFHIFKSLRKTAPPRTASIKQERPPIFHRPAFDVERGVAIARNALPPVHLPGWGAIERSFEAAGGVGRVGIIVVFAVGAVAEAVSLAARVDGLVGDLVVEVLSKARIGRKVDGAASLAKRPHVPPSDSGARGGVCRPELRARLSRIIDAR